MVYFSQTKKVVLNCGNLYHQNLIYSMEESMKNLSLASMLNINSKPSSSSNFANDEHNNS